MVAAALVDLVQRLVERVVVGDRPPAKAPEQPALHLGGAGLGVGDAEDRLRPRAAEQQPRHARDQGVGLAGPRIGLDEDRGAGVGGGELGMRDGGHASPSKSPTTCHSQRRARWS
jgi:hypothetical protein